MKQSVHLLYNYYTDYDLEVFIDKCVITQKSIVCFCSYYIVFQRAVNQVPYIFKPNREKSNA